MDIIITQIIQQRRIHANEKVCKERGTVNE